MSGSQTDRGDVVALTAELTSLRAENAWLLRLLKLTRREAAPPGPAQAGFFEAPPGAVHAGSPPEVKVAFFGARFFDRVLFADSRTWVCSQATGNTLEVAIGTGLNLPLYPGEAQLTGIDLSAAMLGIARRRAEQLGRAVDLREADALALPFPDASFDSVVCTFSLCAIPDDRRAVSEMNRVLRPGGILLLADHIAGATWPVRGIQRILEVFTVPLQGEHYLRRPLRHVQAEGFSIDRRERFKLGLTERLAARKPAPG